MNISSIDVNLLVAFDAILKERNITLAANRVGISQPAMSNALTRMRNIFNDRLFVRTARGMEPTPYAEQLASPISGACALITKALQIDAGFDPATSARSFTFYMTDIGEIVFLPTILAYLKGDAPRIGIKVVRIPERDIQDAMTSGDVDLAVGLFPSLQAGFFQQRLYKDTFVCIVRADHPKIKTSLTKRQFMEVPHAVVSSAGTGHGAAVEKIIADQHLNRRMALAVPHFLSLPVVIAQTDLIATIPHRMALSLAGFSPIKVFKPPIKIPSFDIKQHWHERYHHDAANKWMRSLIAKLFLQ